jgi:hypothetical protein
VRQEYQDDYQPERKAHEVFFQCLPFPIEGSRRACSGWDRARISRTATPINAAVAAASLKSTHDSQKTGTPPSKSVRCTVGRSHQFGEGG